jgi:predicted nucleotidyltransferase
MSYPLATVQPVPPLLLQRILDHLEPEQIWLFGSRARGDNRPDSDWDLLLVLPDHTPDALLDDEAIWDRCLRGLPIPADLIPVRRRDFEAFRGCPGSLCKTVSTEGVRVYER